MVIIALSMTPFPYGGKAYLKINECIDQIEDRHSNIIEEEMSPQQDN